jgi:hypothetical protein
VEPRTINRSTAWNLLKNIGRNMHELRNKGEIKISSHLYLSISGHGTGRWIYTLSPFPKPAPPPPSRYREFNSHVHPLFQPTLKNICRLVNLSA